MQSVEFLLHERRGQGNDAEVDRVRSCPDGWIKAVSKQRLMFRVHGIDCAVEVGEFLENGCSGFGGLVRGADECDGTGVEEIMEIVAMIFK